MAGRGLLPLLVAVLLACSPGEGGETVHPTEANLPPDDSVVARVGPEDRPDGASELHRLARRTARADTVLSLGTLTEEDGGPVFGPVEDVAADSSGRIYVLDGGEHAVRVFGPEGGEIARAGGSGRGPSELPAPAHLELTAGGDVLVLDRAGWLKRYGWPGDGEALVHRSSHRIRTTARGACVSGDTLVTSGGWLEREGSVHLVGPRGERLAGTGGRYRGGEVASFSLTGGPVACSRDPVLFLSGSSSFPWVRAFDPGGSQRWIAEIDDFRIQRLVSYRNPDGRPGLRHEAGTYDYHAALTALGPGHVLLQVARHDSASLAASARYASLRAYLLAAATGEGVFVGRGLPVIHDRRGELLYGAVNDPYPRVLVLRLGSPDREEGTGG